MPEISTLPVASVAPTTGGSAATAQAPRDPGTAAADPTASSFLTQLQSALASIGLLPQPTVTAATSEPAVPAPPADDDTDDADLADILPEALAALGFVPVPAQLPLQPMFAVVDESQAAPAALPVVKTPMLAPLMQAAPADVPARHLQQQADAAVEPADASGRAEHSPAPNTAELLQHMTPVTPEAQPSLPIEALTLQPMAPEAKPKTAHAQPKADAALTADAPAASAAIMQQVPLSQHFGQPTGNSDGDTDTTGDEASTNGVDASQRTDAPGPSFNSVAAAATQRTDAPSDVKPAHVVSQIAHQADLYRLPGGRGVRIQLHPDDLGGVGVTIKYGAAGSLELHVNVEHAATADLVQAGWNQLRDALSLQGIAPERLIMSVSGPTDSSLSGQSGSFRSDGGQASFGQTGQQTQHDRDHNSRAAGGFTSIADAPVSATDDVRATSTASNSRIDYRV
jgi:flagellar hook-length control protein FliK